MKQSEQINELAAALAKAQSEIKTAGKGKENPFFKSSYADLAMVREACIEALTKNNLAVTQSTDFDGDVTWLETTLMHSSGQWISGRYRLKPVKDDPQGMGSAVTYAKRYALAAMVGVVSVDEDDDGEAASGRPPQKEQQPNRKTAATQWAAEAEKIVATMRSAEDLSAWHRKNATAIAHVRDHNEAAHKRLVDAIQAKSNALTQSREAAE
jgi:hypothetical protein